jgi:hypothetical protein
LSKLLNNFSTKESYEVTFSNSKILLNISTFDKYGYLERPDYCGNGFNNCSKCWDREIPETDNKKSCDIDLHKLIDDAMEKKDRRVHIFITKDATSVNVEPLVESNPRWIERRVLGQQILYICSECGSTNEYLSPYCPVCGEKLKVTREEEESNDDKT